MEGRAAFAVLLLDVPPGAGPVLSAEPGWRALRRGCFLVGKVSPGSPCEPEMSYRNIEGKVGSAGGNVKLKARGYFTSGPSSSLFSLYRDTASQRYREGAALDLQGTRRGVGTWGTAYPGQTLSSLRYRGRGNRSYCSHPAFHGVSCMSTVLLSAPPTPLPKPQ